MGLGNKVRLLVFAPIPDDPTSFYRSMGPITALSKSWRDLQIMAAHQYNWTSVSMADVLMMQRPCDSSHYQLLQLAHDMGIPVWVDFDDDNLAVPKDNPQWANYQNWQVQEAIVNIARNADVLSVSTQRLKKKYSAYRHGKSEPLILPNAIHDSFLHLRNIPQEPRQKMFLWRGTTSHLKNLRSIEAAIIASARKHLSWDFTFFGVDPIDITENIKNAKLEGMCPINDYYKKIVELHPTCLYYPLAQNSHAQCRSHISWLEGTFAGAVCLAYKNEEFTRPGLLNFSNGEEFCNQVDKIVNGEIDIDKHVNDSWQEIQDKYLLSKINVQRKQIIEELIASK
jgi:hypothetical protein